MDFEIFLSKRFQGLGEPRSLISFSERDVRLISAAFSHVQKPGEGRGFSVPARRWEFKFGFSLSGKTELGPVLKFRCVWLFDSLVLLLNYINANLNF